MTWTPNDATAELHLGDSVELIPKVLDDGSVDCVITDPPYGVDAHSNFASTPSGKEHARKILNDASLEVALNVFHGAMSALEPKLAGDCDVYVFTDWKIIQPWIEAIEVHELEVKQLLIWEKGWPGLGDLHTNWGQGYECILYAKRGKRPVNKRRSAVLHYDKPQPAQQVHPHEKPVALLQELLEVSTNHGDLIVDPFAGSGSTLVAARDLGRNSVGFELDPAHHETASRRLGEIALF